LFSLTDNNNGSARATIVPLVMPGLVPGIHVLTVSQQKRRGWPGQARP
jgi:hypothetical protein